MPDQTMPGANVTAQWFADNYPGTKMDVDGGVLHSTEGFGWPGYDGGAKAPNLTFLPLIAKKRLDVRQHFPVDMSSRALKNLAGGVQTNTLNVVQIELVGTCDPGNRTSWGSRRAGVDYIFWPDAPDWLLTAVAARLLWLETEHGVPVTSPVSGRWTAYPASAGQGASQRLSASRWEALKGWVGHQHVPENDHGDPGALDFPTIAQLAQQMKQPPVASPIQQRTTDMLMFEYFDEVWLVFGDGTKKRLTDPDLVHAHQANGVPKAPIGNVVAKKMLAFYPTRP